MSILPKTSQIANADLCQRDQQITQDAASTTIAEVVFVPAPDLPGALVAAVEVFPSKFMVGFRSDIYTREQAGEIARLVIGPFHDRTDEAIAEVTPC